MATRTVRKLLEEEDTEPSLSQGTAKSIEKAIPAHVQAEKSVTERRHSSVLFAVRAIGLVPVNDDQG
jgi:hypothetical protein